MDVLRAPWRMDYINSFSTAKKEKLSDLSCIFCSYPKEENDEENLILVRGAFSFVILNRFPYASGHLMIVPYRHTSIFPSLSADECAEIFSFSKKCVHLLEYTYAAQGFNIGFNVGHVAGAGIDAHLHMHIVPRWDGDTNFISAIADTKVLPEALDSTRNKLLDSWNLIFPANENV